MTFYPFIIGGWFFNTSTTNLCSEEHCYCFWQKYYRSRQIEWSVCPVFTPQFGVKTGRPWGKYWTVLKKLLILWLSACKVTKIYEALYYSLFSQNWLNKSDWHFRINNVWFLPQTYFLILRVLGVKTGHFLCKNNKENEIKH